ncbi:MAG TPA: hypothetical protein VLM40_02630 [Gemmata sp.]|nr:hypothetical protein [Gemmata sp.]
MNLWTRFGVYLLSSGLALGAVHIGTRRPAPDTGRVLARETESDGTRCVTLLSPAYRLDQVYQSMTGPRSFQSAIRLADDAPDDETVYLTAVRTDLVEDQGLAPTSNEYFCHSNLTLNPETISPDQHNATFSPTTHSTWRFFTLVPGRMEIRLPEGFGIPVKASTRLDYFTMALNLNPGQPERTIRMKSQIRYRRAGDGGTPVRPVYCRALSVYQQHREAGSAKDDISQSAHHGEQCGEACQADARGSSPSAFISLVANPQKEHPGFSCCVANASADGILPQFGADNTIHWMVPRGKHRYRSEVTEQLQLHRDTAAHYVTGHLHPFGEWLRLIDMNTGKTVLEITSQDYPDRIGVKEMSEIISREGLPLVKGHRYELVAEYNNTTDKPIDAMAILYAYIAE